MRVTVAGGAARGLLTLSIALMSSAAFAAPDAKAIADSLVAALQAKGKSTATYDSATASGDDVTISNLKITAKDGGVVTIPSFVIASPAPRQPGGFTASGITFDNGSITDEDSTIKWATGSSKDAIIPDPSEMHAKSKLTPFSHLGIGNISVSKSGQPDPVTIDAVDIDLGNVVDGAPNDGKLAITNINVPGSVLASDESTKSTLDELGYQSLSFNFGVEGGYDAARSAVQIRSITLDGKDMGKLTLSGDFGGLPRDKLQNPDEFKALAATATLDSAQIRFDDAGITNKMLDVQAKRMGGTRDALAQMLPAALPMAFSQVGINDEALQKKVVDAATAFLKDPKSLTISLAPSAPVLLKTLGTTAMSAPQTVPGLLGIDVQANN